VSRRKRRAQPGRAKLRGYLMTRGAVHPDDLPGPYITRKCREGRHDACGGCECRCHEEEASDVT
jgi:hypothetical protein